MRDGRVPVFVRLDPGQKLRLQAIALVTETQIQELFGQSIQMLYRRLTKAEREAVRALEAAR
jgi:hypothetical protein